MHGPIASTMLSVSRSFRERARVLSDAISSELPHERELPPPTEENSPPVRRVTRSAGPVQDYDNVQPVWYF